MKHVGYSCKALVSAAYTAACVLVPAAIGCSGYIGDSGRSADDPPIVAATPRSDRLAPRTNYPVPVPRSDYPVFRDDGSAPQQEIPVEAGPDQSHSEPMDDVQQPTEMDASQVAAVDAGSDANLRVVRTTRFTGYLTDSQEQPLYMFVGDVPDKHESACLGDCAREWPPFDIEVAQPSADIDLAEVSRFHRQDGAWQTTYKGHALYYRAAETGTREVTGDGVGRRWFVARDYLAFMSSAHTFAPAGGTGTGSPFLTDGFGWTLYASLDDQARTPRSQPISSCDTACIIDRPILAASSTRRTKLLPSVLDQGKLSEFVRPDGRVQVTYRGWPLYYHRGDTAAGSADGHNDGAWRAIDPISFGLEPEPQSSR